VKPWKKHTIANEILLRKRTDGKTIFTDRAVRAFIWETGKTNQEFTAEDAKNAEEAKPV